MCTIGTESQEKSVDSGVVGLRPTRVLGKSVVEIEVETASDLEQDKRNVSDLRPSRLRGNSIIEKKHDSGDHDTEHSSADRTLRVDRLRGMSAIDPSSIPLEEISENRSSEGTTFVNDPAGGLFELSNTKSLNLVHKLEANCPDGKVGEVTGMIEASSISNSSLCRIGREASVVPEMAVKEIRKNFLR